MLTQNFPYTEILSGDDDYCEHVPELNFYFRYYACPSVYGLKFRRKKKKKKKYENKLNMSFSYIGKVTFQPVAGLW